MSLLIGKNHVSLEALHDVAIPEATESFAPIPHILLVEETMKALEAHGFEIVDQDHVLARQDKENKKLWYRYFGGFALSHVTMAGQRRQIVCGIRNANDKSFAAAICIGNRMMVCENLDFSSEEKLARRHTKNIKRDLPEVIAKVISRLTQAWENMESRIEAYEQTELSEQEAARLIFSLAEAKAITNRDAVPVFTHWLSPDAAAEAIVEKEEFVSFEPNEDGEIYEQLDEKGYQLALDVKRSELIAEFGGNTLWGLYNAVTHCLKGSDLSKLPTRTMTAQSLFDARANFSPVIGEIIGDGGTDEDGIETDEAEYEASPEANFEEGFE